MYLGWEAEVSACVGRVGDSLDAFMAEGFHRSLSCTPSRPDQIFGLDLAGPHLPVLSALLYVLDDLLLLILKLYPLSIKLPLCFF